MIMARRSQLFLTISLLIALLGLNPLICQAQNVRPVADAGSSRYAGPDPVVLDGSGSYDPDNTGILSYTWRQIDGPPVVAIDANTATPTIAGSMLPPVGRDPMPIPIGFDQTDKIQECEFELVVSNGESTSLPDTVKVIIVPNFGENLLELNNVSFDPNKPTIVYFGGGDCTNGTVQYGSSPFTNSEWLVKANILYVPKGYDPDSSGNPNSYYKYGDMLLVYLSAAAPDYKQLIQTSGWSTGGQPAIDAGSYVNSTYKDKRYAINRVTFFDATSFCRDYSESLAAFLDSSVDGEQCWVDNYISTQGYEDYSYFYDNVLNIWFDKATDSSIDGIARHRHAQEWYNNSLIKNNMVDFHSGVVAGAYWSVIGPGKNLQLAFTPDNQIYKFTWYGWNPAGYMDFYDELNHPGRLPEPVTLVGPEDDAFVDDDGAVFSCEESKNSIGYQLLFGSDQYRVMDYIVVSDTPNPPEDNISEFPFEKTWWTVRAYDGFGSTIYADPRCINAEAVSPPPVLPHVLYIQEYDNEAAESFQSLLADYSCSTTLIKVADITSTPIDTYDLVIVANDTRYKTTWSDPNAIAAIQKSGKPILGLGDGGYDFFGLLDLSIGSPNGGHGSKNSIKVVDPNSSLFQTPNSIEIPADGILQLYTETNHIGLYFWPTEPETVTVLGREADDPGYYPLAMEHNRYLLWGFIESPQKMTEDGKRLFINVVIHTADMDW